jgi:hypothetical protein
MSKNEKQPDFYQPAQWMFMAKEDLKVAKIENVHKFIRCFHAQQSIEKMLKTAFVVTVGRFDSSKPGWVLDEIEFPKIHDLVELWEKLSCMNGNDFQPLDNEQTSLMKKLSHCAVHYRYPYLLKNQNKEQKKLGLDNIYICYPEIDTETAVQAAEILLKNLENYILSRP